MSHWKENDKRACSSWCEKEMKRTAVLVERLELLRLLKALNVHGPSSRPLPVPPQERPVETVQGTERWGRRKHPGPCGTLSPRSTGGPDQRAEDGQLALDWPDEASQVPPGWEDAE